MRFSKRAKEAEQSPSLSLAETMRKLRSNGMEITNFGARPDVPSHVIEAAKSGVDAIKFQTHIASAETTIHEPWRVKFSKQDKNPERRGKAINVSNKKKK